ncbi:MAG: bifunctional 5,10-methylenetetrahydrofolate dehydrogenase/5,10-methenyltetrahydrofolate cyclohydrolase [Planctomycetota bacterium]|nr:MAG: bifunctional 5,10-methylenetetrahydrofolate dehydrogenase/5,10-methenyltetrahydrofolate cyclohydrolase [Planctomycetota bacterium]
MATILDGRAVAQAIRDEVRERVELLAQRDRRPNLVSIQVGESEPSRAYIQSQRRACAEVGILYSHVQLDPGVSTRQLAAHVRGVCANPEVTGLIVQLPVPERIDVHEAYLAMDPAKDVEGMHPHNLGSVMLGTGGLQPCTALAVRALVHAADVSLRGAEVVVVGHSEVVGKPIAVLLLNEDATVTVCHAATRDLAAHTRRADVLVVAVGRAGLIGTEHVRPGAVVLDVGMNYLDGAARPVGDVRFGEVEPVAGALTPVPGGVGPVTVAMLLRNTVAAAEAQAGGREAARAR